MEGMEIVKSAQLDLLSELKRICDKHNIKYFLVGGTLIGAIRHNGFIPWDDDIDVGMLRDDYEKFITICGDELDDAYQLYDWKVDPKSPIPFSKLKIKTTHYKEDLARDTDIDDGIFIDVFPYDNAPESKLKRSIQNIKNVIIKKSLLLRLGYAIDKNASGFKNLTYAILRLISYFNSVEGWKKTYDKNSRKYNHKKAEYVVSLGGSYSYARELKRKKDLQELIPHIFENDNYLIPRNYDVFLRQVYGDYMKLPPEEERTSRHKIILVDLGTYRIRSERCK